MTLRKVRANGELKMKTINFKNNLRGESFSFSGFEVFGYFLRVEKQMESISACN